MMWDDGTRMSGPDWLFMGLGGLLLWALIIAAVVLALRNTRWLGPSASTPEQVLAQRYARGEIDEAEYRRRLQILQQAGGHRPGSPEPGPTG
jgi:putative membrane protein